MAEANPTFHEGLQGDYVAAYWGGRNTSGLIVFGKNVLIACDDFAPTTSGGVIIPDNIIEKLTAGTETGCIFAMGPEAFRLFDDGSRWTGPRPETGHRVYFEKYAGQLAKGRDGHTYRIMDYRCIGAGLDIEYLAELDAEEKALEAEEQRQEEEPGT